MLERLSPQPRVLALSPRTIADIWNSILEVGNATARSSEATRLVAQLKSQISGLADRQSARQPRVLCLEWLDPPYIGGRWVPEVALGGGIDSLGRVGEPGSWQTVLDSDPDLILAMPCGYHTPEVEKELRQTPFPPEWYSLRAVRNRNVFAIDASSYFSRPGPRIAEGILVIADLFQGVSISRKSASKVEPMAVKAEAKNPRAR